MKGIHWSVLIVAVFVVTSGCAKTRYVEFDDVEADTRLVGRVVEVEIDREYYENYPDCVVVMPPSAAPNLGSGISDLVESALSTTLTRKLKRVVGAVERDMAARRMAVDLIYPEDRVLLLKALDCDAFISTDISGPGNAYYLVWSEFRIELEMRLLRAQDGRLLWRALHVADRSGGGLPLSPIGAIVEAFSSTRFSVDPDVTESVVDDAVRRMVASLPNSISY